MSTLRNLFVLILVCAVFILLANMGLGSGGAVSLAEQQSLEQRIDQKLKHIVRTNTRTEEQIERLLAVVEALERSSSVERPEEGAATPHADEGAKRSRKKKKKTAITAAATATAGTAETADEAQPKKGAAADSCPGRRPYHTVLTATGSNYQQWQARIMYHHWKKQSAAGGPCTDMAAFTRLCATANGRPDGLQDEIPTLFTVELSAAVLNSHFGFGVLNRPNSVKQLMESEQLLREIRKTSDYVLILETDHVIMQPIPNWATPTTPAAFVFGYMYPQRSQDWVIKKYWPEGSYKHVQPVGPSPVLIHLDQLAKLYQKWLDFSLDLRSNSAAESVIQGWVQEMWGYSIAAASLGIQHKLIPEFQVEPGALSQPDQLADFRRGKYYIFHYTYQFEYMLDGTPCQPWNIGEWSLDKRHFNDVHPAYPLPQPPHGANEAGIFLLNAWNEAMAAIPNWPKKQPAAGSAIPVVQTLYGRRRLDWFSRHQNGFAQELSKVPLVQQVARQKYKCTSGQSLMSRSDPLELKDNGDAILGSTVGRWGTMNDPTIGTSCPVNQCLFIDMRGGAQKFNAHVEAGRLTLFSNHYTTHPSEAAKAQWSCVQV